MSRDSDFDESYDENLSILKIRTLGDWSVLELSEFLNSWNALYNGITALQIQTENAKRISDELETAVEDEDFPYRFRRYRDDEENYIVYNFYHSIKSGHTTKFHTKKERQILREYFQFQDLDSIIENIDEYRVITGSLKIFSIKIASPGFISFEGLGGILKQIRKLIEYFDQRRVSNASDKFDLINKALDWKERTGATEKKFIEALNEDKDFRKTIAKPLEKILEKTEEIEMVTKPKKNKKITKKKKRT